MNSLKVSSPALPISKPKWRLKAFLQQFLMPEIALVLHLYPSEYTSCFGTYKVFGSALIRIAGKRHHAHTLYRQEQYTIYLH
jgi:hypothetical protein